MYCVGFSMLLQTRGDREQDLWRYWLPEGCIKKWYDRASGYGCLSNMCLKGEQWSSDLAVSRTLPKHCDIQSENTNFQTLWLSPLTTIHIDIADSCVLPVMFLRFLSSPIVNIRSCLQDLNLSWIGPMEYHPHSGFHYSKLLKYLCYDYGMFINISGINLDGNEYRQVSFFYPN